MIYSLTAEQYRVLKKVTEAGRVYVPICGFPGLDALLDSGYLEEERERQTYRDRGLEYSYDDVFVVPTEAGRQFFEERKDRDDPACCTHRATRWS